jgi:hypothetical protein
MDIHDPKTLVEEAGAVTPEERALRADIDRLAKLPGPAYQLERKSTAKKHNIRTTALDALVKSAQRNKTREVPKAPVDVKEVLGRTAEVAGDLVKGENNILERFGAEIVATGLVEETENAKLLYLALTSRLFDWPVSSVIKGVSAGGKSITVEKMLEFLPASAYLARTGMSDCGLVYSDEDFRHRHLVLFEAPGMESEKMSYFVRTLLSERRIVYETVEKTENGLRSRLIEKPGPTGLITTTTATMLHPENETRMLSLNIKDTPEQTAEVLKATARAAEGKVPAIDVLPWQAFQEWLAAGETRVTIPFAESLAGLIPPVAVRLRRDFRVVLALIQAHALLHRGARGKDSTGRIVATLNDYKAVQELVGVLLTEGVGATVNKTVRNTVEIVRDLVDGKKDESVSYQRIVQKLKLDRSTVVRRVRRAIVETYLLNLETREKQPARIALGDPLPDDSNILPSLIDMEGAFTSQPPCTSAQVADNPTISADYPVRPPCTRKALVHRLVRRLMH